MKKLVETVKAHDKIKVTKIVTFADNQAVNFFKKQGFRKLNHMQQFSFKDKVEIYSRATQMQLEFMKWDIYEKPCERETRSSCKKIECDTDDSRSKSEKKKDITGSAKKDVESQNSDGKKSPAASQKEGGPLKKSLFESAQASELKGTNQSSPKDSKFGFQEDQTNDSDLVSNSNMFTDSQSDDQKENVIKAEKHKIEREMNALLEAQ